MKKDVENEKKIISELLLHKSIFIQNIKGEFELVISYGGRGTKISKDGNWKVFSVRILAHYK